MKKLIIVSVILPLTFALKCYSQGILELNKELGISLYKAQMRSYPRSVNKSVTENNIVSEFRIDANKFLADASNFEFTREKDNEVSALGSFTFTGINVVPNLNIIGSHLDSSRNGYLLVMLYGIDTKAEGDTQKNKNNFFINEASAYGFSVDGGYAFVSNKNRNALMVRGTFTFANKIIPDISGFDSPEEASTSYNISNIKLGLEFAPLNFLCFYANFNYTAAVTNIDKFKSYFLTSRNESNFFDAGIEAKLTLNKNAPGDNSQDVWISLGAMFTNASTDKIYSTNDSLIPTLTIGIQNPFFKD